MLTEQAELADGLLALDIAGERLSVGLNQPFRDKLGAPALIQPLPRLAIHQVSTQGLAIPLHLRQIITGLGHHLASKHRPLTNIRASKIKRLFKRVIQPRSRRALSELLAQRVRFRSGPDTPTTTICTIPRHKTLPNSCEANQPV